LGSARYSANPVDVHTQNDLMGAARLMIATVSSPAQIGRDDGRSSDTRIASVVSR
jgi:hypothetical protein